MHGLLRTLVVQSVGDHLIVNCLVEPVDDSPTHIRLATRITELLATIAPEALELEPGQVTGQVTGQVIELLHAIDGSMSRNELQAALGLTHRDHFTNAYLSPALEAGPVEMTIPDKPTSSRQKYQLTDAGRALLTSLPKAGS